MLPWFSPKVAVVFSKGCRGFLQHAKTKSTPSLSYDAQDREEFYKIKLLIVKMIVFDIHKEN